MAKVGVLQNTLKMIWLLILFQAIVMKATVSFATEDNSLSRSAYLVTRENKRLADHVVKQFESPSLMACSQSCLRKSWCTSTNFKPKSSERENKATCELNRHEFDPINDNSKLIDQPGTTFSMFLKGCLMSGCLNGGPCRFDKKKETFNCACKPSWSGDKCEADIDECESNTHNCSDNSICINIKGSFSCTCKPGYKGDGRNCPDIDECETNTHNCSDNSICINTKGSFNCTCKPGYNGDGRNCTVSECLNYQNLTRSDRKVTHGSSPLLCDNSLGPGWFRFQGNAGTKMPTSCVPPHRCGTDSTGWLNSAHPTVQEGKVTRKVCFSWSSNCCTWSINIQVLNCGPYFLYFISGTPPEQRCYLRYCGAD